MLCSRIAAGGFALLAASVVNASAQNCLLPWACQGSRSSAEEVEPKGTDANSTQDVKNNSPSQKALLHVARPDPRRLSAAESHHNSPSQNGSLHVARRDPRRLSAQSHQLALRRLSQKEEPSFKEIQQGQHEKQSSTPTDQAARDALFDEFLQWQVHQMIVEPGS
jgi:hypothetical protein